MKKLIFILSCLFLLAYPFQAEAVPVYARGGTCLTGGAAGCLDSYDGETLNDGDSAFIIVGGYVYIYILDADSAAAESSPSTIKPDDNAGDKRWILQNYYWGSSSIIAGLTLTGDLDLEGNSIVGTSVDINNAELQQISTIGTASFTADEWGYLDDITAAGASLIDDSTVSDMRTTLGLAIGSDVLAYDVGLQNLAGVTMAADKFYYTSADNVHVAGTVTSYARSILDDANAATARTSLGLGTGDSPTFTDLNLSGYLDLTEIAVPDTASANTLRLFVEDFKGFSFFSFKDSTGMVRKIVRDSVFVGKNVTGSTIAANRIVYASGNVDDVPTIAPAKADADATMPAIGVTIESIADGAFGRVMQVGLVENVNTSAYSAGDVLYVSATTAGVPTATAPTYPNIKQEIGTILVDDASVGAIQVVARGMDRILVIGTDVLAQQTIGIANDNLLEVDGSPLNGEVAVFTAAGINGLSEAEFKTAYNMEAGVDFQAYDADLTAIAALSSADSNFIVGSAGGWVAESGATARTSLGVGTGDSVEFTGLTVSGLTASRLVATNGSKALSSVSALASWVTETANETSVTDDGDGSITIGIADDVVIPTSITIPNTGLHILDSGGDHDLILSTTTNFTQDRTLYLDISDSNKSLIMQSDLHVESDTHVNQDLTTNSATVGFAGLALTGNLTLAANSITGTSVDINNSEMQQISNIGATTISSTQWAIIGGLAETLTYTELNYVDGVTSGIQAQLNNKQASDADLTAIAALSSADNNFIVGSAGGWVAESGATARASLGVDAAGTDNSTDVTLHASATTGGLSLSTQEISFRAATNAQTGYATAAHITAIEANTAKVTNATHSGEVTGATELTIANDAVTYAKMQNVSATDKILGRATAGAGDVEEIACTSAGRALLDDATAAAQLGTLGLTATASEINTPLDGASVTLVEFQQLETIGATTISAAQWGYLGSSTVAGGAMMGALTAAAQLALLSGQAAGDFSWNSRNLTSVGTIGSNSITVTANNDITLSGTGHVTSGSEGFIVGTLTMTAGSIDDTSGSIAFGATNFTGVGTIGSGAITTTGDIVVPTGGAIGTLDGSPKITFTDAGNALNLYGIASFDQDVYMANGKELVTDKIRARGAAGLILEDDGDNAGLTVLDGGNVKLGFDLLVDGGNIGLTAQSALLTLAANAFTVTGNVGINTAPGTMALNVLETTDSQQCLTLTHSDADNPRGIHIDFSGGSPNNQSDTVIQFEDSTENRFIVYSDGTISSGKNSLTPTDGGMIWVAPTPLTFTVTSISYEQDSNLLVAEPAVATASRPHFVAQFSGRSASGSEDAVALGAFYNVDTTANGQSLGNIFGANIMTTYNTAATATIVSMYGLEVDMNIQGVTDPTNTYGIVVIGLYETYPLDVGILIDANNIDSTYGITSGLVIQNAETSIRTNTNQDIQVANVGWQIQQSNAQYDIKEITGSLKFLATTDIIQYFDAAEAGNDYVYWRTGDKDSYTTRMQLHPTTGLSVLNGVYIGAIGSPSYKLDVLENVDNGYVANFFHDGNNANRNGIRIQAGADNASGTTVYLVSTDGDGDIVGYIENASGTYRLVDGSDERLKRDITPTSINGLEIVKTLNIYDYYKGGNTELKTGWIANDVLPIYPQAVSKFPDSDMLGLSKIELLPVLWKAVQELSEKVDLLEKG